MTIHKNITYICGICSTQSKHSTYQAHEMMFGSKDSFEYFQCDSCACLQIAHVPNNLQDYYPEDYAPYNRINKSTQNRFVNACKKKLTAAYLSKSKILHQTSKLIVNRKIVKLCYIAAINLNAKILDVGCGNGMLLQQMQNLGFNNLTGIEPFIADDIIHKNNIVIYKSDVFSHQQQYDFIMLHHSLEHMPEQQNILNKLQQLLKPQGKLLIRIPLSDCYAWKHYGINWFALDAPRHLYLHSRTSFKLLIENAGFQIEHVLYDSGSSQFKYSELYQRGISLQQYQKTKSLHLNKAKNKQYKKHALELNRQQQGDQACFLISRNNKL